MVISNVAQTCLPDHEDPTPGHPGKTSIFRFCAPSAGLWCGVLRVRSGQWRDEGQAPDRSLIYWAKYWATAVHPPLFECLSASWGCSPVPVLCSIPCTSWSENTVAIKSPQREKPWADSEQNSSVVVAVDGAHERLIQTFAANVKRFPYVALSLHSRVRETLAGGGVARGPCVPKWVIYCLDPSASCLHHSEALSTSKESNAYLSFATGYPISHVQMGAPRQKTSKIYHTRSTTRESAFCSSSFVVLVDGPQVIIFTRSKEYRSGSTCIGRSWTWVGGETAKSPSGLQPVCGARNGNRISDRYSEASSLRKLRCTSVVCRRRSDFHRSEHLVVSRLSRWCSHAFPLHRWPGAVLFVDSDGGERSQDRAFIAGFTRPWRIAKKAGLAIGGQTGASSWTDFRSSSARENYRRTCSFLLATCFWRFYALVWRGRQRSL